MNTDRATADSLLPELSRVLWQQRDLIERLEYRLEVQQLIMVSGRSDRLPTAVGEVEAAIAEIKRLEEQRLRIVGDVARALGLPATATITQLRNVVAAPWDVVLSDHHTAFLKLVASTEQLSTRNRDLAHHGLGEARAAVAHMGGAAAPRTYGKRGGQSTLSLPPTLIDQQF
jgi:hypothetical protein